MTQPYIYMQYIYPTCIACIYIYTYTCNIYIPHVLHVYIYIYMQYIYPTLQVASLSAEPPGKPLEC